MDNSFAMDHNYEFDAPRHQDFGQMGENDQLQGDDTWFDRKALEEGGADAAGTAIFGPNLAQQLITDAVGQENRPPVTLKLAVVDDAWKCVETLMVPDPIRRVVINPAPEAAETRPTATLFGPSAQDPWQCLVSLGSANGSVLVPTPIDSAMEEADTAVSFTMPIVEDPEKCVATLVVSEAEQESQAAIVAVEPMVAGVTVEPIVVEQMDVEANQVAQSSNVGKSASKAKVTNASDKKKKKKIFYNSMGSRIIPISFKAQKPLKNPVVRQPPPEEPWVETDEEEGITPELLAFEAREDQNRPARKFTLPLTRNRARLAGTSSSTALTAIDKNKKKRRSSLLVKTLTKNIGPDIRHKLSQQRKVTTGKPQGPTKPVKATAALPAKVVLPLTVPQEFTFETDNRVSRPASPATARVTRSKRFEENLRNYPPPSPVKPTLTIPQPYNFSGRTRRPSTDGVQQAYKSSAQVAMELEQNFRSATPDQRPGSRGSNNHSDSAGTSGTASSNVRHIGPPILRTAERVEERKDFEEFVAHKHAVFAEFAVSDAAEAEAKEALEVKRIRKDAEFKANPVPKDKRFVLQPCDTALTIPQSPKWVRGPPAAK